MANIIKLSGRDVVLRNRAVNLEALVEHAARVQMSALKAIDPDDLHQAIKHQSRRAAAGDLAALQFLLSLVGMGKGIQVSVAHRQPDVAVDAAPDPDDDDDDDDDE